MARRLAQTNPWGTWRVRTGSTTRCCLYDALGAGIVMHCCSRVCLLPAVKKERAVCRTRPGQFNQQRISMRACYTASECDYRAWASGFRPEQRICTASRAGLELAISQFRLEAGKSNCPNRQRLGDWHAILLKCTETECMVHLI